MEIAMDELKPLVWRVETDDGELIGIFDNAEDAYACADAPENRQAGNWPAPCFLTVME